MICTGMAVGPRRRDYGEGLVSPGERRLGALPRRRVGLCQPLGLDLGLTAPHGGFAPVTLWAVGRIFGRRWGWVPRAKDKAPGGRFYAPRPGDVRRGSAAGAALRALDRSGGSRWDRRARPIIPWYPRVRQLRTSTQCVAWPERRAGPTRRATSTSIAVPRTMVPEERHDGLETGASLRPAIRGLTRLAAAHPFVGQQPLRPTVTTFGVTPGRGTATETSAPISGAACRPPDRWCRDAGSMNGSGGAGHP